MSWVLALDGPTVDWGTVLLLIGALAGALGVLVVVLRRRRWVRQRQADRGRVVGQALARARRKQASSPSGAPGRAGRRRRS